MLRNSETYEGSYILEKTKYFLKLAFLNFDIYGYIITDFFPKQVARQPAELLERRADGRDFTEMQCHHYPECWCIRKNKSWRNWTKYC